MKSACFIYSKVCAQVVALSLATWLVLRSTSLWIRPDSELASQEEAVTISSFETNWPGYKLPRWAKKKVKRDVPKDEEICYVHVGKAGGSSVGCSLGFSLHCGHSKEAEGVLPKVTTHIFHKDVYDCRDDSAYFLFVARDPIDRARSAFNYDLPDDDDDADDFYARCKFFRFEDYVRNGLTNEGDASEICKDTARGSLAGTLYLGPSHFYYNYQYYLEAMPSDAHILVIRNEHMKEDWDNIQEMLGGKTALESSLPRTNVNTWADNDDLYLSEESITTLCQALCNEIQQYKVILRMSENLDEEQVQASLLELGARCPNEAHGEVCQDPLPNIDEKLREDRGYAPEDKGSREAR